jgi:hypothetical protein
MSTATTGERSAAHRHQRSTPADDTRTGDGFDILPPDLRRAVVDVCWPKSTSVLIPRSFHVETRHSFGCHLGSPAEDMGSWGSAPLPATAMR